MVANDVGRFPTSQLFFMLVVVCSAAAVGLVIAKEKWIAFAAVAVLLLVIRWPVEVSLGTLALLLPFDSVRLFGGPGEGTAVTYFVAAFTAAVLLLTGFLQKRFVRPPIAALWWTLFVAWGAASYFWAVDPASVADRLLTAGSLLVLFLIAVSIRITETELHRVAVLCIIGGCAAAIIAARQYGGGLVGVHEQIGFRETLTMGGDETNPGQFASTLLLPLSLGISYLLSWRNWFYRIAMAAAVGVLSLSLLLTMARSSLVALLVVVLVFLIRMRANIRLIVSIGLLASLVFLMPALFFERLSTAVASGGAGRLEIWTVGLASLKQFGLFGGGLDNFPYVYDLYASYAPKYEGMHRGSHNIYLCFAVELGIIGLCLMLAAIWSHFRPLQDFRANRSRPPAQLIGIEAGCWAMLTAAFFIDVVWRKAFWFDWILLATAIATLQSARWRRRKV